eukprot:GSMAST32.ASY1.ANO1.352.1 assembled CDS
MLLQWAFTLIFGPLLALLVFILLQFAYKCLLTDSDTPKRFRPFIPTTVKETRHTDCTRDAFRPKKLPEKIDYIVVGSGISGLYCAGLLSKCGYRVVVLEQHYVAGGCTHSFEDKGFEFDTGLHYVGRMEKYSKLFDLVSGEVKVRWAKMGTEEDGHTYDEIKLSGQSIHRFRAGKEKFINDLASKFPAEREGIIEYVRLVRKVNKLADLYFFAKTFSRPVQWLLNTFINRSYYYYANKTASDVVNSLISNPHCRARTLYNFILISNFFFVRNFVPNKFFRIFFYKKFEFFFYKKFEFIFSYEILYLTKNF